MSENSNLEERQKVYDYIRAMLGEGMVDVELDPIHYETAVDRALTRFRQRSPNAVEESYSFLEFVIEQNEYRLPDEIIEVRQLFRRSIGSRSGSGSGGTLFEPFNMAYTNTYLLSGNMLGGLLTYELFSQYQELVGRMFGSFIEFKWNPTTKVLTLLQRPRANETLLLHAYNYRPESQLLQDYKAREWIKSYTLANCKYMLGEARSKFNTVAGPQGGTTLNGDTLKAEAQAEMDRLDAELATQMAGGVGYHFTIG